MRKLVLALVLASSLMACGVASSQQAAIERSRQVVVESRFDSFVSRLNPAQRSLLKQWQAFKTDQNQQAFLSSLNRQQGDEFADMVIEVRSIQNTAKRARQEEIESDQESLRMLQALQLFQQMQQPARTRDTTCMPNMMGGFSCTEW